MVCFAANSLLCREALGTGAIDPASFTAVRLVSGVAVLLVLARLVEPGAGRSRAGSKASALALFGYAIFFSFAYSSLDAGVGALILFAAVQITMIAGGLLSGERPRARQWLGIVVAIGGLVYLLLPGLSAPEPTGAAMMGIAGVAWGVYSLRGRGMQRPVSVTMGNFIQAAPLGILMWLAYALMSDISVNGRGVVLAAASGAGASGMGYAIWYTALRGLTATSAAAVQLFVPVIAAIGGIALLGEDPTLRLALASTLILGGVGATILSSRRTSS